MQIQFDSFSPHIDVWMDTLVNRRLREKDFVAWGAKIQTRIPASFKIDKLVTIRPVQPNFGQL